MTKTSFERVFGESAVLKILDVLMTHPSMDYSKKELAEAAGIAESTVHRSWKQIEQIGAIQESRRYGGTTLYKLDQDSETVKQLYQLDQELKKHTDETEPIEAKA